MSDLRNSRPRLRSADVLGGPSYGVAYNILASLSAMVAELRMGWWARRFLNNLIWVMSKVLVRQHRKYGDPALVLPFRSHHRDGSTNHKPAA